MTDDSRLEMPHSRLTPEQVVELERSLGVNPDDVDARKELLIHYILRQGNPEDKACYDEAHKSRLSHIIWVVEHRPDTDVAGSPFVFLHPGRDDETIPRVKELWEQHVATYPQNALVLGNAAKFLTHSSRADWPKAHALLNTAERLDPTNPEWPDQHGRLMDFERRNLVGPEAVEAAQQGLKFYERACDLTVDDEQKVILLSELAKAGVAAEEYTKARAYATRLLDGAPLCKSGVHPWMYGNAVHWGHIVLGRVDIKQGDIVAASQHLLEAGNTPGSPQLNSFGPDVALARELLALREQEAVTSYLKACSKFWVFGKSKLTQWVSAIRQDRTPDFNMSFS